MATEPLAAASPAPVPPPPATAPLPPPAIDWAAVRREAIALLQQYIRLDTRNPPGNEIAALDWLASILRAEGIAYDIHMSSPTRGQIIARLPGDGSHRPLILMHHADVVAAEPQGWTVNPYEGAIRDGYLVGCGAIDCKSLGVMHLLTVLLLKRHGIALNRDVVFLCCSDEEAGGEMGAKWLVEKHPELVRAEYLFNEGAMGLRFNNGAAIMSVAYAEKGILWVRLRTHGEHGHGSIPRKGSAMQTLHTALGRVYKYRPKLFISQTTQGYLEKLARHLKFPWNYLCRNAHKPWVKWLIGRRLQKGGRGGVMLGNTIAVTNVHCGQKENQIPATAEAILDCRIHPEDTPENFLRELKKLFKDLDVEIEVLLKSDPTRSPVNTPLYRVIDETMRDIAGTRATIPLMTPGTTDMRFFRPLGTTCYGLLPILLKPGEIGLHELDERISLDNLELGTKLTFEIIRRFCGKAPAAG